METVRQSAGATDAPEVRPCPECGTEVTAHPSYVTWCAACDWNVDPGAPDPERGRLAKVRRRLAARYGEQLAEEIGRGGSGTGRVGPGGSTVLAFGLALLVHGVTAGLFLAAVVLIIGGWHTGIQPVLGVVLLVAVAVLMPRPGRAPSGPVVLYRADAPELFGLIDEVGAAVGTTGVHAVVVDSSPNAWVSAYGYRGRRVMCLGLGLWEILTPQERVALLGHELGHFANGDIRSSFLMNGALRSLAEWHAVLVPVHRGTLMDWFMHAVTFLPRWTVYGLIRLLDGLTLRASQRAEYLADTGAARAGSGGAAVTLLDRLLVAAAVEAHLRRESMAVARAGGGPGGREVREAAERELWERLAARIGSVPESEYERLRRVSARRGHSVDDTHPPTHLRRRCLASADPQPALVVCDGPRAQAVAAELAPARAEMARQVIRDHAG
ncbi:MULTISPECIES: M48 family metallopeptidase [unclassified Streptomyces]|uniref:M48 family metallopeptidase n=1 Tax=unclassified Streptomyces TaxID=2593676 RepID=UPI00202E5152|nr:MULTISPECIES: M48 family metallopeptidase [unclassified Streptomyces]MCM1965948.1 M48 family metalloprotease [Streptomyces sp. G1]MCX5300241.1 M48 family metalloprotease [Streptomyces sp. NBC_00193]